MNVVKKYDERGLRSLDLRGQEQREQQRMIRKQEQQLAADAREAYERGFRSAYAEAHRKIDLRKLAQSDPAMAFWLSANRDPWST